jgi:hypothetical protein
MCENGSPVFEHRHVAEQVLGRKLKKHEIVHHLDGDTKNNDRKNLVILSRGKHLTLHAFLKEIVIINGGSVSKSILVATTLSWLKTANVKYSLLVDNE